jgi:hypothetical protein
VVDDDVEDEVFAAELRATSFHEAGHCVAGWEYGQRCTRLVAGPGRGLAEIPALGQAPAAVRVAVAAAGFLSARQFCYGVALRGHTNSFDPSATEDGCGGDCETIRDALSELGEGAGGDEYQRRLAKARTIVCNAYEEIGELAELLAAAGEMDEADLARAVRRPGGVLKRYVALYPLAVTRPRPWVSSPADGPDLAGGRVRFFHPACSRCPAGRFEVIDRARLPRGAERVSIDGTSAYCVPRGGRRPAGRSR